MRGSVATDSEGTEIAEEVEPEKDSQKPAFKIARVLTEAAMASSSPYTSQFDENWKYAIGENHWPTPTNRYHMAKDEWKAKTVRNRLFKTIDQKAAMVLDATPSVHAEPVSADVPTEALELASSVVRAELKRLRWHEIREDIFLEGAVNGKAIAHVYTKKDSLAAAMGVEQSEICAEVSNGRELGNDPSATRLSQCRYFVHKMMMDYSRAIEAFPDAKDKLKPNGGPVVANLPATDSIVQERSNEELVTGPGGDLLIGKDGKIKECKVPISMVWIRDDSVLEEIKYKIDQYGNHTEIADETNYSRAYPYGRLIVTSGEWLLYDGESPYEIDSVLPYAEYTHYRNNRRFWGYGEVAHLKSAQMVADKTMAIALDGARKVIFGNLEVPIGADQYDNKGNAPDEVVRVEPELSGMAHYVTPNNVNMQFLGWIDGTNDKDFGDMSGVSDALSGALPTTPTSGKEVQSRAKLASTRIGRTLKHLNEWDTDFANIVFQLMRQNYVGERTFMVEGLNGELEAIKADVSMLPPGIAIRIESDPDEIEKSELEGQNVQALVASGMLYDPRFIPFMAELLPSYGIRPQKAKQLQKMSVQMVQMGMIPTDPMAYQLITGQPMPPEMFAQYQVQQMMAMAAAQPSDGKPKQTETSQPA